MTESVPPTRVFGRVLTVVGIVVLLADFHFLAAARRATLVISGGTIVTVDGDRRILDPGSIAVDGDTIVAVDTPQAIARQFVARQRIDATGQVVLPGLINTHTHAPMVLYRGLADDLALMEWLQKYIFPAEAKTVSPEFVRVGTRLAVLEMIQSGTTTYTDMYYFEEEIARATADAGMRGVLGQTIIQFPVADAKTPQEGLKRAESYVKQWRGHALITPAVAPHSMYTLDAATLRASRELCRQYGVPTLIHLAETRDEVRISTETHKMSPTAYLDSLAFWGRDVIAAHGVWLTPEDIALLKQHQVGVSHNPESNMKLASGTAPVPALLEAGVAAGLGTDGAASNNDLDMFEAMRQAAFLHKLSTGDPRVIGAPVALEMATRGGAAVLGMEKSIGSIEVGKKADLIIVNMRSARQTPRYDAVSHLVYATRGDDVQTTIVNGRVLMRDRRVVSLPAAQVLREARDMAARVRSAVAQSPNP